MFTYFWFVQLFLGLGIAVLIKDTVKIVAGDQYQEAYLYVPLILISYMCYGAYSYLQFGLLLEKKTIRLSLTTLSAAAINTVANFTLIPLLQIWGAALATLISFVYLTFAINYQSQRLYYIPYQKGRLVKMTVTAAALYAVASAINPSNVYVSFVVKFLIAASLPVILYFLKFFTREEIEKLKALRNRVADTVKAAPGRLARLGTMNKDKTV